jgi:hypothetical protein
MNEMRAKFTVYSVTKHEGFETLKFNAVGKKDCKYGPEGEDEDNTYARYTPSAVLEMTVTNPALIGKFVPGQVYRLDFSLIS